MILVDTSVWVEHFRAGDKRLSSLLDDEQVLAHPFVVGELACGALRNREEILKLLSALPRARDVGHGEVLRFVEVNRIYSRGIGWVDANLLASAVLTGCALWTLDKPLQRAAASLEILA